MKWLILISVLCMIAGTSLAAYAMKMPYYTNWTVHERIENEVWDKLDARTHANGDRVPDMSELYAEWYSRMNAITTPHKKLSDLGRGLCAVGLGVLAAIGLTSAYKRWAWMRAYKSLRRIWILLWALQVPFAIWYYGLRATRGDYPGWSDSIMIPIMGMVLNAIVGAILSSILLSRLVKKRRFPEIISFDRPASRIEWVRFLIFLSWLVILGCFIVNGTADGNEGDVITCTLAASILLICYSAKLDVANADGLVAVK